MPVTLRDIAEKVGYSITTVSRALAGYDDVAEETRRLILQTAQEMGYHPNIPARQLQRRRTDTLGFVIATFGPRFSDPFLSELLAGIGNEAARHEFDLLVATHPPRSANELHAYRRLVRGRRVDGLIITRTRVHDERIAYLLEQKVPFATFGRSEVEGDFPWVDVDGEAGLVQVTRHLIQQGHRRIAIILPPADLMFSRFREAGFRRAMAESELPVQEAWVTWGDLTEQGGYQAARRLLGQHPAPTAIIAGNDVMAIGAIRAAREHGLTVGREIAIAGFDDIPMAEHTTPPLTTLRQPIYEIGRRLCRMLIALLRGETLEHPHVLLQPELVIRQSTVPEA